MKRQGIWWCVWVGPASVLGCALLLGTACGSSKNGTSGSSNGSNTPLPGQMGNAAAPGATGKPTSSGATPGSSGAPGASSGTTATSGSGSWCNALSVLRTPCQQCHGAQRMFGAPMSMVTYQDMIAPAVTDKSKKVYELVRVRIHDTQKPMPPAQITPLTAAQIASLDSWIDAGAQPGADPTCGGGTTGGAGTGVSNQPAGGPTGAAGTGASTTTTSGDWPSDCEMHYTFLANSNGGKASIAAGAEVHPSFYFMPPWPAGTQAVEFRAVIDNSQVLHHWILYAQDGAFLAGWAPGNNSGKVPSNVGIYMPSGTDQLRLDVHYNNVGGSTAQQDASGVELCVISTASKLRPHTATTYGLTASATAPAHMMVTNTSTCTVSASMGPAHVIGQSPHMHKLGVHAKLEYKSAGAQSMVVQDAPFDFNNQLAYSITPDLVVNSGDTFTTSCTYNNTTDTNVTFGQNTENEMCFNFIMYWPKGGFTCPGAGGLGGLTPH